MKKSTGHRFQKHGKDVYYHKSPMGGSCYHAR